MATPDTLILAPPVPETVAPAAAGEAARAVPAAAGWLGLALASILLAGLLSLSVVLGRIPWISALIADPLFYKRCLVVHVDLALVVWFYAFLAALAALCAPRAADAIGRAARGAAALGVAGMIAGGLAPGAAPVLANYVPVIDHPLFLGGLGLFFAGTLVHVLRAIASPGEAPAGGLPGDAVVGVQTAGIALALAAATWISARAALPAGLDRRTFFELAHWGPGHVLQVANVAAMLAVWCWLLARATGRPLLKPSSARGLFFLLLAPHLVMPLLSWQGVQHRTYVEGATLLMRWGIFPVVLGFLILGLRHLRRHRGETGPTARVARAGFAASAGLTALGFVLGALIRGSTTLVPAHYHASLGGVTAAFMAAAYLILDARAREAGREPPGARFWRAARRQLAGFGAGQAVFALGFGLAGLHGLGRKAYAGEQHVRTPGELAGLAVMGLGGLAAAAAGIWFLSLAARAWRARTGPSSRHPLPPAHP